MHFVVLTLFKEMVETIMNTSIMGRALDKGLISLDVIDIRDYAENKHNRVDDYPYGGGAGMVMQAGPVYKACEAARELIGQGKCIKENAETETAQPADKKRTRLIYLSPIGRPFTQEVAKELSKEEDLMRKRPRN